LVSKAIVTLALATLLATPVLTPLPAGAAKKKKPQIDTTKLVWPLPPAVARVRYIGEYHGEDVKGRQKQGLLERLAGVEDVTDRSRLIKPYGIAVDSKGRAFVTDTVVNTVFVFDIEKKTLEYRGDKPPAALKLPMGVAVDDQDRLFVSDALSHNITAFTPDGNVIDVFGEDDLIRPVGIAIDSILSRIYVADVKVGKIAVYDLQSFKFQHWIGKSREDKKADDPQDDPTVLASPTSLAVDPDGLLYVADTFMNRVVVFDTDGEFVRRIGDIGMGPGKFMRPRGVALDCDGHIYITDGMAHLFQVLTPDGQALTPVGGLGENPGHFQVPAAIAIDKLNRIFVADQNNRRIQVFRYITDAEAAKETAKPSEPAVSAKKK
jgi:DNA-binding beta-propeller fold protein YncE